MNILFLGDGKWAQIALEKVITIKDINISGVVLRYNTPDTVLKNIAEEHNIDVYVENNVNNEEFIKLIKSKNIDLGVSMSFDQIIKKQLRESTKEGFINCHAGKLPNYRGRNILNWALINDEKEIGITAHYIDDGIDTGDIISQYIIPVEETDDYFTLLCKSINKCPEVLIDAILKIKKNKVEKIPQSHINGTYFSYRRNGDELIDWNWSSRRIHNFIRALVEPAPGAQTYLNGDKICIWKSEETNFPDYISTPGEIIRKDKDGIIVKTGDNAIKIKLISYDGDSKKVIPKIPIGNRFGINLMEKVIELENRIKGLT
ncbi:MULTISPECIES: methionyl-tRNA formyltransferase [Clostridium]|uniref:Methionyl-tRNA formyltransferase n=2 Tax=Clostridium TaxID=1485 RepID=A0A846J6Q5_CLOBO|nr:MULTISPECIES: methionyl-tRNA formyltransferase [Clostridium]NFH67294.1 methionyl-tRNA formyltransferase [Clostridium botulinum]ACA54582.1 methionyl-tRNA formyltransferase [Clostridium botulinum A3 str. Loch Maree]NFJ09092.1 methionyl-tRNA formyltransferase [Clostridium botulinum]NFK13634.1 methionyl-tRNA formyltransferase [Clostridium botulinum]NFM95175.1 methionyl-tRNA formyltransferase [Clostridium botulinum]